MAFVVLPPTLRGHDPFTHPRARIRSQPEPSRAGEVLGKCSSMQERAELELNIASKTNTWLPTQHRPEERPQGRSQQNQRSPTENHAGCSLRCSCAWGPGSPLAAGSLLRYCSSLPCPPSPLSIFPFSDPRSTFTSFREPPLTSRAPFASP